MSLEEYGRVYTTDLSKSIDKNHNNNDLPKILVKSGKIQKGKTCKIIYNSNECFLKSYKKWND